MISYQFAHSDLWPLTQRGLFLHTAATHWVFYHSGTVLCKPRRRFWKGVKIAVDQLFVTHSDNQVRVFFLSGTKFKVAKSLFTSPYRCSLWASANSFSMYILICLYMTSTCLNAPSCSDVIGWLDILGVTTKLPRHRQPRSTRWKWLEIHFFRMLMLISNLSKSSLPRIQCITNPLFSAST